MSFSSALVAAMMRTSTFTVLGAAYTFELSLLKNAQQLHLQRLTHVAYFIEEDGSLVRLLKPPIRV
jgi:hypothetical protein